MKKKYVLAGLCIVFSLFAFTGCINTRSLETEMMVIGSNKKEIQYDLEDWKNLISEIEELNRYNSGAGIGIYDRTYDEFGNSTYVGADASYIHVRNVDCEQGEKAAKYAARHTGDGIYEVIEAARNVKTDKVIDNWDFSDEGYEMNGKDYMVTKTVGDYSVIGINRNGEVGFYIMHEPFTLTDEADQTFINAFKTDGFLLRAFSKGKEERVIEIAMPSYIIRTYGCDLYNSTSYYQFFRNENNELIKMRMVINAYGQNDIYKEEFGPLEEAIAYYGGEEKITEAVENEINAVIKGSSEGKVIKIGNYKCTIQEHDGYMYKEKLIEIVIK